MNSKDKELLSDLYEMEHYKALTRLLKKVRADIADKMLAYDMTSMNAERHITFLQGQAFAIKSVQDKVKDFHKKSMKD